MKKLTIAYTILACTVSMQAILSAIPKEQPKIGIRIQEEVITVVEPPKVELGVKVEPAKKEVKVEPMWNYNVSTDITQPSGMTAEQLNSALEGTGLQELGEEYLKAESNYGINAVVLMGIHVHESGWGNSSLAISNNNLGGIKNKSGDWATFDSIASCIDYSAELLGKQYLKPDGKFYNGTDLTSVNIKYCETDDWAGKVVDTINSILSRING